MRSATCMRVPDVTDHDRASVAGFACTEEWRFTEQGLRMSDKVMAPLPSLPPLQLVVAAQCESGQRGRGHRNSGAERSGSGRGCLISRQGASMCSADCCS